MSAITRKGLKPFHIVCTNGVLRDIGKDNVSFRPGVDEVYWFDTLEEREQHHLVVSKRLQSNSIHDCLKRVELPKNPLAYAAMRQDALDWLRADSRGEAEWDAQLYPALAITVECCSMTPTDAARSITKAVKVDVLDPERQRTLARENLKAITKEYLG